MALGFHPAIGFIHTGNMESFVFDIADLYKDTYIIPLAFSLYHKVENQTPEIFQYIIRSSFRDMIVNEKFMAKITKDLLSLFSADDVDSYLSVNEIYDIDTLLPGGINYGGNF